MPSCFDSKVYPHIEDEKDEDDKSLPEPVGGTMLIRMIPLLQQVGEGLIAMIDDVIDRDNAGSNKAIVMKQGPSCYRGDRFEYIYGKGEAWCNVGDTVVIKRMAGVPIPGSRGKYQLINDDQILATYRGKYE